MYLYGVLAVAVLGTAGHDPSDGWTPTQMVDDNPGNQATVYLVTLRPRLARRCRAAELMR